MPTTRLGPDYAGAPSRERKYVIVHEKIKMLEGKVEELEWLIEFLKADRPTPPPF